MKAALNLMVRFGVLQPLIGDIVEASAKRSRLWFWSQAFAAVTRAVVNATFQSRALTASVVASALTGVVVTYESALTLYLWATRFLVLPHSRMFMFVWHVYALPLNLAWCVGAVASGIVTVRLASDNRNAFAVAAAVAQIPVTLWWGVPLLFRLCEAVTIYHLPMRFAAGWVFQLSVICAGIPLCVLLGGMLSTANAPSRRLSAR